MLVLPIEIQSVFDTMTSGASNVLSDVLTVVIGILTILLIVFGLHTLIKIMLPSGNDNEDEKHEEDKYHV